jgi:hypothetical protein
MIFNNLMILKEIIEYLVHLRSLDTNRIIKD